MFSVNSVASSLYETRLQAIVVVVLIILEWIFVLMNITTSIPCKARKLAIMVYPEDRRILVESWHGRKSKSTRTL